MKKLVRDKIPEIMINNWQIPKTYKADKSEYYFRLREKLKERWWFKKRIILIIN